MFRILSYDPSLVFIFKLGNFIPMHIYLCYENVDYRCNPREYRDLTIKCECSGS